MTGLSFLSTLRNSPNDRTISSFVSRDSLFVELAVDRKRRRIVARWAEDSLGVDDETISEMIATPVKEGEACKR